MFSPSVSFHLPALFDSESFTDILPFDQNNLLAPKVQSDHVEIALKVPGDRIINIWNISNPAYHCYFKYGDNPPFHKTHLFINQPFVKGVMDAKLAAKVDSQASTIAVRFVRGADIQVIIEGYESFYHILAAKIRALGHQQFHIISLLNKKPEKWREEWNVTAILIDTSRYFILESGIVYSKYAEEQDDSKEQDFYLPFAHVRDVTTAHTMVIAGVHINGCGSQYPKTGLETLAKAMEELRDKTAGESEVIAAGDYNTPVKNARECMLKIGGTVLKAPYPTHVNPKSQAANYDQVSILPLKGAEGLKKLERYKMLPPSYLSAASQHLIMSIDKSRQAYLAKPLRSKL